MVRLAKILGLGFALATAAPSTADVKAGMAAWDRGDYAKAIKAWQPLAVAGDADAEFNLGQAYRLGKGVAADPRQAESWYQKAAAQGHSRGELLYAIVLQEKGTPKDAIPWLEKAASRGEHDAQYLLAVALYYGKDTARDWVRAYGLMKAAADGGVAAAKVSLAAMDKTIPADQREKGVAAALQLKAALARLEAQQATRQFNTGPGGIGTNVGPPAEPEQ